MSLLHLEPVGWYEEGIGVMEEKHFDTLQPVFTETQLKAAVLAEREAIASWYDDTGYLLDESDIAAAIRARGNHA